MSGADHPVRDASVDGTTVAWRQLLDEVADRLVAAGIATGRQEARWLVEEASGLDATELVLGLERPATVGGVRRLDAMAERRCGGEPVQYVLGHWAFRHLDLLVDRRVLIPRPETEQVVGWALDELDRTVADGPPGEAPVVVDLGTGSGAIALSVAVERPGTRVWATDAAPEALAVARANLAGIGRAATGVALVQGSWFDALPDDLRGRVAVVVANPPYVAEHEVLPDEVARWEPASALVAGPTGLEALEAVVDGARSWLAPGGAVVVELAPHQAEVVAGRARQAGFAEAEVRNDLAGRARAVVAR